MKKLNSIIILFSFSLFLSCHHNNKKIGISSINIDVENQHSYLVDHDRILVVRYRNKILAKFQIYSYPGSSCDSYLFENDSAFTLIDCNGQWYSIHKSKGTITNLGWHWNKELPANKKGVFIYDRSENNYKLCDTLGSVYKFKNPQF